MIELIHKYPILIKTLLTVVTVTFIATGGWMLGSDSSKEFAAKVDGEIITVQEFQKALAQTQEFYRNIYQGNIPADLMDRLDLPRMTVEALVDRRLMLMAAEERGIEVTDEELAREVRENSSFADETGNFSKQVYVDVLGYNDMIPAAYEQQVRADMTIEKFRKAVTDSVYVSDESVLEFYKQQLQAQGKEFNEEEFEAQKESYVRAMTSSLKDKTMKSFMEGLRQAHEIQTNADLLASS